MVNGNVVITFGTKNLKNVIVKTNVGYVEK